MKKLLVILLLLFPIHGAWAEEKIEEMFGLKFGQTCNSDNFVFYLDYTKNIERITEYDKTYQWEYPLKRYRVKPPMKNKEFKFYNIDCTAMTNRLYAIRAISESMKCDHIKIDSLKQFLRKKYKLDFERVYSPLENEGSVTLKETYRHLGTINQVEVACTKGGGNTLLKVIDTKLHIEHRAELIEYKGLSDKKGL